jgi:hypothetical protein
MVLRHLLVQVPTDRYDVRRFGGEWGVKEWVCHLVDAQQILLGRFEQFEKDADPLISDYQPPPQTDERYRDRDLSAAVADFTMLRAHSIVRLRGYDPA